MILHTITTIQAILQRSIYSYLAPWDPEAQSPEHSGRNPKTRTTPKTLNTLNPKALNPEPLASQRTTAQVERLPKLRQMRV